jgi:hypothetical protein
MILLKTLLNKQVILDMHATDYTTLFSVKTVYCCITALMLACPSKAFLWPTPQMARRQRNPETVAGNKRCVSPVNERNVTVEDKQSISIRTVESSGGGNCVP